MSEVNESTLEELLQRNLELQNALLNQMQSNNFQQLIFQSLQQMNQQNQMIIQRLDQLCTYEKSKERALLYTK